MTPQFAEAHQVSLRTKQEPFSLQAIDGKPVSHNHGMVAEETGRILLRLGRHREKLQFDITESPGSDVVLGLPWLKGSNALINWKKGTILFEDEWPKPIPLSVVHDALDMIDICAMTSTETRNAIQTEPENVQVLWSKKTDDKSETPLVIPPEYSDFKALFETESD